MSEISRSTLFGKLNAFCFKSIEGATVFCKLRGNPYVELNHWLHQMVQSSDSDLIRIIRHFDLDESRLARDLVASLDRLPRGATSISDFAPSIEDAIERSWVYASLLFGASKIRSGHLIAGIMKTRHLRSALLDLSLEFEKIKVEALSDHFDEILSGSTEAEEAITDRDISPAANGGTALPGSTQALEQYTIDLTEQARKGNIDPVVGREDEVRQIIDILMRRRQNNPILTGEAGVGKTAVVEGFALKIASGDVPPPLRDVALKSLDIGLLQAGASMKGEFEARLRSVIDEVQSSAKPIILFIDEAHTLVGAGGAAGTGDAANLLKPALARGTLRTIAATTWAEYKKHIEKDPALTRRFQVVQVHEPSEAIAIAMMRGVAAIMEKHHNVLILDEALEASVRLSHRYIPARQLPDKSVSLLDTACARVAVSQHATPASVDACEKQILLLETELDILGKESRMGVENGEKRAKIAETLANARDRLEPLKARWAEENRLVGRILEIRATLRKDNQTIDGETSTESAPATATLLDELQTLQAELGQIQGEHPLILPSVDQQAIASVVQDWTGIPVGKMVRNEIESILNLAESLEKRIIGQRHALEMISRRIQTSRAGLDNPSKPIGVFMLAGTSGVGKTETALALAETLYGGEHNVITINMSEYQEAHTISTLKGSPPGYVGYGEGGVLTEAVRRKPYSVVLLDEIEKAHPDVHELFFQVFDKGWMEDGEGRIIDFKNTLILLTTNVGTDMIMSLCQDPELMPHPDGIAKALRDPLLKVFPPALLGRLVVIPYFPLNDEMIRAIAVLQIGRIQQRIAMNHGTTLTYHDEVIGLINARCTEMDSGGRIIDSILTNSILPKISEEILRRQMNGETIKSIEIGVESSEFTYRYA